MNGPCTTIRQYRDRDQDRQNRKDAELEAARQEADSFSFGPRHKSFNPRLEFAMEATGYVDRKGAAVHVGDIIKYDEGKGFSRCLNEVVMVEGMPHGVIRIGCPEWSVVTDDEPIHLMHYKVTRSSDDVLYHGEVIGNVRDNPELLTVEYARKLWP